MMVVPRSFASSPPKTIRVQQAQTEKARTIPRSSPKPRSSVSALSTAFEESKNTSTREINKSKGQRVGKKDQDEDGLASGRSQPAPFEEKKESTSNFTERITAKDILSATAIPIRRKPRGRASQRLPRGDHVNNFSKLLLDDVGSGTGRSLPRSLSNPSLDGLFGYMDEVLEDSQMYVGSEGINSGILSKRSVSDDSLVSSSAADDFNASDEASQYSATSSAPAERRSRQFIRPEDCSTEHPLVEQDGVDDLDLNFSPPKSDDIEQESKPRSSLKFSLSASLRAIKSAAKSMSSRSPFSTTNRQDQDVIAHSFFEIQPSMTDDRMPPSLESATPEQRRYFNAPPPLEHAAQLNFWQDHRHHKTIPLQSPHQSQARKFKKSPTRIPSQISDKINPANLPAVVPLSRCIPSPTHGSPASAPPIWLTQDGTPINRATSHPLLYNPDTGEGYGKGDAALKHREPRENRDFLRVYVMEMQMRKNGKLVEEGTGKGRARLWLPPVTTGLSEIGRREVRRKGPEERLGAWLADVDSASSE